MGKINIDQIKLEREIEVIDASDATNIMVSFASGKMPIDREDIDQMVTAIRDGVKFPPVVLNRDNVLVDGHHRYMAYKRLGMKEIPFTYDRDAQ